MEPQNMNKQNQIYDKLEEFVLSIHHLSSMMNGDLYNFKNILRECVSEVPDKIKEGFNSNRRVSQLKSFAFAKESLEQCKQYLSMMNKMRMISTIDLIKQVEEINFLLDEQSQ